MAACYNFLLPGYCWTSIKRFASILASNVFLSSSFHPRSCHRPTKDLNILHILLHSSRACVTDCWIKVWNSPFCPWIHAASENIDNLSFFVKRPSHSRVCEAPPQSRHCKKTFYCQSKERVWKICEFFATWIAVDSKDHLHDKVCIEPDADMPASYLRTETPQFIRDYWAMCWTYAPAFSLCRTWNHKQLLRPAWTRTRIRNSMEKYPWAHWP